MGKLPAWAKKQVEGQVGDKQNGQNKGVDFPKGKSRSLMIHLTIEIQCEVNDALQLCQGGQWQNYQNKGFVLCRYDQELRRAFDRPIVKVPQLRAQIKQF